MSRESELLPAKTPALFILSRAGGEFLPRCQHFLITLVALLQLELREGGTGSQRCVLIPFRAG